MCSRSKVSCGLLPARHSFTPLQPDMIPNILADRYASDAMKEIWSAEGRIIELELQVSSLQDTHEAASATITQVSEALFLFFQRPEPF